MIIKMGQGTEGSLHGPFYGSGSTRRGGGGFSHDHKQQVDEKSCHPLLTACSLALPH